MSRTKRLRIDGDFRLRKSHLKTWAHDFALTVCPLFEWRRQTPILVLAPSLKGNAEIVRAALKREFRDVTFASAIPRDFTSIALTIKVAKDSCHACGEPAKRLETIWAAFEGGRPIPKPAEHATATPCPACGRIAERRVEPPRPAILAEIDGL